MHYHDGADIGGYHFSAGQSKRIRWSLATDAQQGYGIWSQSET